MARLEIGARQQLRFQWPGLGQDEICTHYLLKFLEVYTMRFFGINNMQPACWHCGLGFFCFGIFSILQKQIRTKCSNLSFLWQAFGSSADGPAASASGPAASASLAFRSWSLCLFFLASSSYCRTVDWKQFELQTFAILSEITPILQTKLQSAIVNIGPWLCFCIIR